MKWRILFRHACLWLLAGVFSILGSTRVLAGPSSGLRIDNFYAAQTVVKSGQTVKLYWKTTNATEVGILGIEKEREEYLAIEKEPGKSLALEGSLEVWPLTSTSYVLLAYGVDGAVVSQAVSVNVDVDGNVKIGYFKSSLAEALPAQTVILSWMVTNGTSIRILGKNEKEDEYDYPLQGSIEVWPKRSTTYLLEATGLKGEITSASVTVNVKAASAEPKILTL